MSSKVGLSTGILLQLAYLQITLGRTTRIADILAAANPGLTA